MVLDFVISIIKVMVFGLLQKIVQFIIDVFYGPRASERNTNGVMCYDILYDWKAIEFQPASPKSFTLKFTGVKDIEYIEQEDVTLYTVTEQEFIFVRTKPEVDIHDAEQFPFLYVAKHNAAVELMRVSRDVVCDYLRGCGKMDRDGKNIAILHNIGRCGSTLIATMVNRTGQCHVLAEPQVMIDLATILNAKEGTINRDSMEYYDIVKTTMLLLTPNPNKQYFIKTHSQCLLLLPLIHKIFPRIRETFMYRAIRPTVTSFKRAFFIKIPFMVMEKFCMVHMPKNLQEIWWKNRVQDKDCLSVLTTIAACYIYVVETKDRTDIKSFSYESLVSDRAAFCKSFFQEIGVNEEHVTVALTAMEKDSQKDSYLSKKAVSGTKVEVTEEALEWGKMIGSKLGIELGGRDYQVVNMPHRWDAFVDS